MTNNLNTVVQSIQHNNEVGRSDKPPVSLNELDYQKWKIRFERYIKAKDLKLRLCMTSGIGRH
ncbi:hypothetical protein HanPI659440_Chr02g0040351 [Helianthus annuus]|nr:hypothetical protein HanPI659440_Chr02g0040351 [Helianthus annuus]